MRSLGQLQSRPLERLGTNPRNPFISPDGEWVGYFPGGTGLSKVSIRGGPPITISGAGGGGTPRGASWGPDDSIIFATSDPTSGLWRVPPGGGEPQELTTPDAENGEVDHLWPEILPNGRAVLFTITRPSLQNSAIAVLSLDTGEQEILVPGGYGPHYAPTGHLVYGTGAILMAVGFDLERLETIGSAVPVLENVHTKASGAVNASY